jgi:DNA modification methylase
MEVNKIYNENCLDTMARMPDGFIDLTVTSPPYDNLRSYNGYTFDFEPIAKELFRVTKQGGVVVWVVGDATVNGSESLTSAEQKIGFRSVGFNIHDTMIYERTPKFPETVRYYPAFEFMFVLSKGSPVTVNLITDKPNKYKGQSLAASTQRRPDGSLEESWAMRNKAVVREVGVRTNIWNYANGFNHSSTDLVAFEHPAIFPEALARDHILSWSNEHDLVYDPFMGSGTTAKAAHQLGRNWIGSEISAEYVDLANKRLEPYLAQANLFA